MQESIKTTKLSRMAALAGSGAKVGLNYLKYYGRRAITGDQDRSSLHADNASEVYETFSQLKGGPLKVAQMLSIDSGLLPPAYTEQFAQAQYSAPPLSYPLVLRTFRRELGREPLEIFDAFERKAAHGASIGQVHKAVKAGKNFAVKVQYPGVADSLRSDLRVLKPIAMQMFGMREDDVADYFKEVEVRLLEETNYEHELSRSMELSRSSSHLENVRFPGYYPEMSTRRILTMDWVEGIPLDRFADSRASQSARDRIGQALWDFYAHQIHELRIFHADPHPGNFLVSGDDLYVLDFGCTKELDSDFYRKQFRFLDPSLQADRPRLVQAMKSLNIILPTDTDEEVEHMIRLFERSLKLLAKPFREGSFDFGDPAFMKSIYEFGEDNRKAEVLRNMKGRRGSPHSIYVNRTYFGLYSLLSRLRARVITAHTGDFGARDSLETTAQLAT